MGENVKDRSRRKEEALPCQVLKKIKAKARVKARIRVRRAKAKLARSAVNKDIQPMPAHTLQDSSNRPTNSKPVRDSVAAP